ncbi:MAG: CRISPR-associated protein Cas4 [Bacteroidales bacterium]|nr:CRISPR-associated protein Cas4 [Bacteroidales bacterium]
MKRLGFDENQFRHDYLLKLGSIAHYHRNFRALPENVNPVPNGYFLEGNRYLPNKYTLVDFLLDEYKLKKEQKYEIKSEISDYISATDLANFTFCPVSYSIYKTFEVRPNMLIESGTNLHETSRLSNRIDFKIGLAEDEKLKYKSDLYHIIDTKNKSFFNLLLESELVYLGHSKNQTKNITNENLKFVGQPDYIFVDNRGNKFIIEEKFVKKEYLDKNVFFKNHKIQLASYIYYLKKINAKYGFLVYWIYDFKYGKPEYSKCLIYRIDYSDKIEEFLDNIYKGLSNFKSMHYFNLNANQFKPNKCAACSGSRYCGHKNGKLNQVTLPYQRSFHRLYKADFPEILRHPENQNKNNGIIYTEDGESLPI